QSLAPTMMTYAPKALPKQPLTQVASASVTTHDQLPAASPPPPLPAATQRPAPPAATQRPDATPPPCRICGAASVAVSSAAGPRHPVDGRLCADCVGRMKGLAQTVPGYRLLREIG